MDSAWLSYVRKGCCCMARLVSVDAASSQSNQRSFRYLGEDRRWGEAIAVSGQISFKFHGGVFACDAVAQRLFSTCAYLGYHKSRFPPQSPESIHIMEEPRQYTVSR
jgi:hypothetical protein